MRWSKTKNIKDIVSEIKEQILQGTNGYESNVASVDLNEKYSLFVMLEPEKCYSIEIIHSESTEGLRSSDCKISDI